MQWIRAACLAAACGLALALALNLPAWAQGGLTPQAALGEDLFHDTRLSEPAGEACATCHGEQVGFTEPDETINKTGVVYDGAVDGRFGNRRPPSAAYAGFSPVLRHNGADFTGGLFWDGRATGWRLGDPLPEQAQGPFLNPVEMNNPSPQAVIDKVRAAPYADLFAHICTVPAEYYDCIGRSIAAYLRSTDVSPFTSKYDYWLKGQAKLTGQERRGLELFNGKAGCAACHPSPLFTDFAYDNVGTPKNAQNPFYNEPEFNPLGYAWVDKGLGGFLATQPDLALYAPANVGKFKAPTLRNVDRRPSKSFVKAYGHNGYFKSLDEIVHFYNTRDVPGAGWPAPEEPANINRSQMGNLKLNHGDELALVAFLRTLSDGYVPAR